MVPRNSKLYPLSRPQKRYHSWEQGGHFTSACSLIIARDRRLFSNDADVHAFVCEPVHNLVHHELLVPAGVTFTSRRAEDEKESEFLASEDPWFRPVMAREGPDGALYVVDMYRYMIEHPDWLPTEGKDELRRFFRDGDDRGRIYRVFPKGKRPRIPRAVDALQVPGLLSGPGGWLRDAAQQSLLWRRAPEGVQTREDDNPATRIQKLYTLAALGALTDEAIVKELQAGSVESKIHALRLAEDRGNANEQIVAAAAQLTGETHPPLRLQLAFTLGQWTSEPAGKALAKIAVTDAADPYIAAAVLSSSVPHFQTIIDAVAKADPAETEAVQH